MYVFQMNVLCILDVVFVKKSSNVCAGGLKALIKCLPKLPTDLVAVQGDSLALELFSCLGEFLKNEYGMQVI